MSSDRNRVIAIFAGVAVVLGGAAFYYVKIFTPNQARGVAREEFAAWDGPWEGVRFCLLGAERSSITAQSLAVHEMVDRDWTAKTCTSALARLTRGPGESSGIAAIEAAWTDVDRAGSKLADAFSKHVQSGSSWEVDALPGAIDNMALARAKLRDALDLPDDRKTDLAALPMAELLKIDPAVNQIHSDPYKPSAGGAIYYGKIGGKEMRIALRAGKPPAIERVDATRRGVPDSTYGAAIEDGKLVVGQVIDAGSIASPAATLALPPLGKDEQPYAIAGVSATPTVGLGLVVLGNEARLVVAREDALHGWKLDPPIAIQRATAEVDLDGRVVAIWIDPKKAPHARIWQAGTEDVDLPMKEVPVMFAGLCLASDKIWLSAAETIYGLSPAGAVSSMMGGDELLGCSQDAAILTSGSGGYQICTASECHQTTLEDAQHLMSVTDVGGKLVGITSHGGVLGVWHEGAKEPVLYGLREPVEIAMGREHPPLALTDGKIIDTLATASKGYVTIRVPAK